MLGAPIYYSAPPRLPPNLTPCHLGTLVPVVTNRDPRVGSGVAILNIPGHGEIELTRHGSRQPCISGGAEKLGGFKFQKGPPRLPGPPRFPAIRQRRRKKKTAPKGGWRSGGPAGGRDG